MPGSELQLVKGNEAVGEAAIRAGCRCFFGYPITPQNELPAYMARRMPEVDGVFLQAESEIAAINMVYGAAGAGARVMTSSSSPGISLKMEGISYIAGAELPCVIVNMMRGGPGLGTIQPAQSDYLQATKGGGHGDYKLIVLAPATLQELADLTMEAFDIADRYRNPVMILGDGVMGQMMEPVAFRDPSSSKSSKTWATTGKRGRDSQNLINSLYLDPEECRRHNLKLADKYHRAAESEQRWEAEQIEDAEYVIVAYGTMARVVQRAVNQMRSDGHAVGLIRPISLWPFPEAAFEDVVDRARAFLVVEMSNGQMVEDVRLAVNGQAPVEFFGAGGGIIPPYPAVVDAAMELIQAVGGESK